MKQILGGLHRWCRGELLVVLIFFGLEGSSFAQVYYGATIVSFSPGQVQVSSPVTGFLLAGPLGFEFSTTTIRPVSASGTITDTVPTATSSRFYVSQCANFPCPDPLPTFKIPGFTRIVAGRGITPVVCQIANAGGVDPFIHPAMPSGASIMKVNASGGYDVVSYFGGETRLGTGLSVGETFLVNNPTTNVFEIYMVGESPGPYLTNFLQSGWTLCGSLMPAGVFPPGMDSDTIYRVSPVNGQIELYSYYWLGAWQENPAPNVGQAYWLRKSASVEWRQVSNWSSQPSDGFAWSPPTLTNAPGQAVLFTWNTNSQFGRVLDADGMTPAGGTLVAELLAGTNASQLSAIKTNLTFENAPNAGYLNKGAVTLPGTVGGQLGYFKLRVWDSACAPSYDAAMSNGCRAGQSGVFNVPLGAPLVNDLLFVTMPSLNTFRSFAVSPACVTILDAKPVFLEGTEFPIVRTNLSAVYSLIRASNERVGATADGATKLLLRFTSTESGHVSFSRESGLPGDGFSPVDSFAAPVETLSDIGISRGENGTNYYFALYTVPPELAPGEKERTVRISAVFTPSSGFPRTSRANLRLERPPVLLVHGTWSSPKTWMISPSVLTPLARLEANGFKVELVDWKDANASNFVAKSEIWWPSLANLNARYTADKVASTRCDVIAHSQGGNLVRMFAQDPRYTNAHTFHKGYFRRFISLATPHLGTEPANVTHSLLSRLSALDSNILTQAAADRGYPIHKGAIEDLLIGSPALRAIGRMDIPTFLIQDSCHECPDQDLVLTWALLAFLGVKGSDFCIDLSSYAQFLSSIFQGRSNDTVVSTFSQSSGGIGGVQFEPMLHSRLTTDPAIGSHILDLLSNSVSNFLPGLESIQSVYERTGYSWTCNPTPQFAALSAADGAIFPLVRISSPPVGTIIQAGSELAVTIEEIVPGTVSSVLILVGSEDRYVGSALIASAPFTTNFHLAPEIIGRVPISVFARSANGEVSTVPVRGSFVSQTDAPLRALRMLPRHLFISGRGTKLTLTVSGQFEDGFIREITESTALQFTSSDLSVAVLSSNGVVTASGAGTAVVTARSGLISAQAFVTVYLGAPQILDITPKVVSSSQSPQHFRMTGFGLTDVMRVDFLSAGIVDKSVTLSNVSVNSDGTLLVGDLFVSPNTLLGERLVTVTTLEGTSTGANLTISSVTTLPVFQSVTKTGGMVSLTWTTVPRRLYQLQYKFSLTDTNWTNLGDGITATNSILSTSDDIGLETQRFYRVVLPP